MTEHQDPELTAAGTELEAVEPPAPSYVWLTVRGGASSKHHSVDEAIGHAELQDYPEYRIRNEAGDELHARVEVHVYATRTAGGELTQAVYRAAEW